MYYVVCGSCFPFDHKYKILGQVQAAHLQICQCNFHQTQKLKTQTRMDCDQIQCMKTTKITESSTYFLSPIEKGHGILCSCGKSYILI